jgi:hypothetical protein
VTFARRSIALALFALPAVLAPACKKDEPLASTAPSASSTPSAAPSAEAREDVEIRPVYPPLSGPAHPKAKAFCQAIYGVASERRAACCGGAMLAGLGTECERNVTGALGFSAIDFSDADVAKCADAMKKQLEGCDWITPGGQLPSPTPTECTGIVKGKLAAGARCRSTLECEGKLRCHGVGPTTPGVCGPAKDQGTCGSVDELVTFTRDDEADKRHPECTGHCGRRKCEPFVKVGDACTGNGACGPGNHCEKGKCATGESGKAGQPCLSGACVRGTRCVSGTCVAPKKDGDECESDLECRGGCVKASGQPKGKCAMECARVVTMPPPSGSRKIIIPPPPPRKVP